MDSPETTLPSNDERVMAALSHISAFMPTIGLIVPLVVWVTQKDKSRYVYFQSIQAIAYHLVMILGWFLTMACYMVSFFANFLTLPFASSSNEPMFFAGMFIPFAVMGLMLLGWVAFIIYAVVAAVLTFQGKDFRYVIIGSLVERALNK